jgi:hypothetical protein
MSDLQVSGTLSHDIAVGQYADDGLYNSLPSYKRVDQNWYLYWSNSLVQWIIFTSKTEFIAGAYWLGPDTQDNPRGIYNPGGTGSGIATVDYPDIVHTMDDSKEVDCGRTFVFLPGGIIEQTNSFSCAITHISKTNQVLNDRHRYPQYYNQDE